MSLLQGALVDAVQRMMEGVANEGRAGGGAFPSGAVKLPEELLIKYEAWFSCESSPL